MSLWRELVSLACRLWVAGVFIYAAYDKVWDPASFAALTAQYDVIPIWLVNGGSVVLAWLEIITGVMLVLGFYTRAAAFWTSGMLIFFTGLMIYAGITGAGFDCGCFPGGGGEAGFETAFRDLFYLIPSLYLLWFPGSRWSLTKENLAFS